MNAIIRHTLLTLSAAAIAAALAPAQQAATTAAPGEGLAREEFSITVAYDPQRLEREELERAVQEAGEYVEGTFSARRRAEAEQVLPQLALRHRELAAQLEQARAQGMADAHPAVQQLHAQRQVLEAQREVLMRRVRVEATLEPAPLPPADQRPAAVQDDWQAVRIAVTVVGPSEMAAGAQGPAVAGGSMMGPGYGPPGGYGPMLGPPGGYSDSALTPGVAVGRDSLRDARARFHAHLQQSWLDGRFHSAVQSDRRYQELTAEASQARQRREVLQNDPQEAANRQQIRQQLRDLELDVVGKEARMRAAEEQIERLRAEAEARAGADPALQALRKVVELRAQALERARALAGRSAASDEDVRQAEIARLEAQIELEQRREALASGAGGDLIQQLASLQAMTRVDLADLQARRDALHRTAAEAEGRIPAAERRVEELSQAVQARAEELQAAVILEGQ